MVRKLLLVVLTAAYAWVIWRMTLTPEVFTERGSALVDAVLAFSRRHTSTAWLTYSRAEFIANIAMFVPVGAIVAMWLPRRAWILAVLAAVGLSAAIEITQLVALPTRVADPRDILSNGLGGLAGATVVGLFRSIVPAPKRRSRARTV